MEELIQELEGLKAIIYKLVRDGELSEEEREIIDKIIEDKDYKE